MVTNNPRPPPDYQQLETGIGSGTAQQFQPVAAARRGASSYRKVHRGEGPALKPYSTKGLDTLQVDPVRGHAQFLEYRNSMAANVPPAGVPGGGGSGGSALRYARSGAQDKRQNEASYTAMRSDVKQQYKHMTGPEAEGGMGLTHSVHKEDPYPDAAAMAADVRDNKHIKTMSSKTTGGHNFFTNDENDQFRAVHDVFGHAGTGRGFSRHGEEAAYLSHSQMFSKKALPALASETRGQNSYLNYNNEGKGFPDQSKKTPLVTMSPQATQKGPVTGPLPWKPQVIKPEPPTHTQGKLF